MRACGSWDRTGCGSGATTAPRAGGLVLGDRLAPLQRRPGPCRELVIPITGDRSDRWHIAFTVIPDPVPASGTGGVVGVEGDEAVAAALSPVR